MFGNRSGLIIVFLFAVTATLLFVPVCTSHVPKEVEGNNSLRDALNIEDPTKSWAIYAEMHENEGVHYYRLELEKDQVLRASLFVPSETSFVPALTISGPGLVSKGTLPDNVEILEGSNYLVKEGDLGHPEYEPFTPASYYYLADFEKEVEETGTYYVIVSDTGEGGRYGLAIGKEERYGPIEWIRVPLDIIDVRQWEGKSLPLLFLPMVLTVVAGFSLLIWLDLKKSGRSYTILNWLVIGSGLLYFGSGSMKFMEMWIATAKAGFSPLVFVTILFALLPIGLGIFTVRKGRKLDEGIDIRDRFQLVAYGILALFIWAGFIVTSVLIFLASSLPSRLLKN